MQNLLVVAGLGAEGKQVITAHGMLFALTRQMLTLTRQMLTFAFAFAYPLIYGRAVHNHNVTSTDGDPNEYNAVEYAAQMAANAGRLHTIAAVEQLPLAP
jgi:hypothetical protein